MDDYLALFGRPPLSGHGALGAVEPDAGVTVLIPTHTTTGRDRVESLRLCVASVLASGVGPVALVVVDSGLSAPAAAQVAELLRGTGCVHQVVPCEKGCAARARNAGLAFLAQQPADSPFRHSLLLFLDDDTALAPSSLIRLRATLRARDRAIAACPRVVPVPDLAGWSSSGGSPPPRRLPGALNGNGYDLLSVTSHGSLVTGRTVGLLVRQEPVLRRVRDGKPLFYEDTPHGSTEDMLAMAALSRLGELWSVPAAEVADEARGTPGATRSQQFAWGYDHAWLARALAEAGALTPGVHTLTWHAGTGWEYGHADWGPYCGFLVNPAELRLGHRMLSAISADRTVAEQMFGAQAEKVGAGTAALGQVLDRWDRTPRTTAPRPDLPPLGRRDWSSLRDGMDALLGHLAGNIAGSLENSPYFLYGARQPAS
jgi:hypothetical protein